MKIDRLDLYLVSMPLVYPFRTAFGNDEVIESVLVRMAGEGLVGWGEATPWALPAYSPEYSAGAFAIIRDVLAPRLIGKDVESGEQLQQLLSPFKGNPFAKAALDLAWWDLYARGRNEPLWRTIGGVGEEFDVGADFGIMETIPALLREIEQAVAAGFKRVKLKYRPGWELDMIAAVRGAFPKRTFHVDCNSAYRLEHTSMLKQLDAFGLAMIEQPLSHDDLIDHAQLRHQVKTPICMDESITSLDKARKAIRTAACDWINIKHGRVGGLTNALAIHEACRLGGVSNWIGGMLESSIGQAFSMALATLPNVKYPSDVFPSRRFYKQDLGPEIDLCGPGRMRVFDGPGIGIAPDEKRLTAQTLQHATVTAG